MPDVVQLFTVPAGGDVLLRPLETVPEATTVHDAFERLGLGGSVYTGLRTFERVRFLALEEHLDRTERSMRLLGWRDAETRLDRERVRRALAELVRGRDGDVVIRLDVLPPGTTAGTGDHVVLTVAPLHEVPGRFLREGVRVLLARDLTRDRPRIKTAEFVLRRRPYPLNTQEAFEHLMLDREDRILEATSANFYVVLDGVVHTAWSGVLEGITRLLCLRVAAAAGIEVRREAVPLFRLADAGEAFLTSSTRGVVPVVEVAGTRIADGTPGPITRRLMDDLSAESLRIARPAWPLDPVAAR